MKEQGDNIAKKIEELERVCRREGLALTFQRRLIIETIAGRSDHPSVDQVFEAVKERAPEVSRTTIYRVLETLVRHGIVKKTPNYQDMTRFDPNTGHHHHVVCMQCNAIVDVEAEKVKRIPLPDLGKLGFEIEDYSVHFVGVCASCRKRVSGLRRKKKR